MSEKFSVVVDINPQILQGQLKRVENELRNAFSRSTNLKFSLDPAFSKELEKEAKAMLQIEKAAGRAETNLTKFGRGLVTYATRFATYTVAASAVFKLIGVMQEASDAALEFDNRLVRLRQITGETKSSLKALSDESFRLATSLGTSQAGLLNIAEVLAQAGYSINDAKVAMAALAKSDLAPTFDNIEKTTDGLIATLSQFNKTTAESEKVLSQINAVSAKFPVESADLITAIKIAGGVFAQTNGQLEEFLGLFTAIRATTRESPETIAQGLKTITTRLQRVKTADFLDKLGITGIRDATTKEFVGVYRAIEILSEGIKRFKPGSPELASIVEELGGVRQVGKVLPLLNNFQKAVDAYNTALFGTTSLNKDAILAQESLQRQFIKTKEELTKLIVTILNNDAFKSMAKSVLDATTALAKLVGTFQDVLPYLAVIGTARLAIGAGQVAKGAWRTLHNIPAATHNLASLTTLAGHADGGKIPGRGSKDDYPALLMRGEYVVSKKGVDAVGESFLDMINSGRIPRFAKGGNRKQRAYNKDFNQQTEAEVKRILEEQSNQQLFLGAVLPEKLDKVRQRAERTVTNREVKKLLAEANVLNELELTGINNPIRATVTQTPLEQKKEAAKQVAASTAKQVIDEQAVYAALERSQSVNTTPSVPLKLPKSTKRPKGRDTKKQYGPLNYVDTLVDETSNNTYLRGVSSPETPRDVLSGMSHREVYRHYRDKGMTAKDAYGMAQQANRDPVPFPTLTSKERLNLTPLLRKEQIEIGKALNAQRERTSLLTAITNKTKEIYKSVTTEAQGGKFSYTKFKGKFNKYAGLSSIALLMASESPLFQNTLNNLGGSRGGAGAAGAIRGGITGFTVGASFGPVGAALGGLAGAVIGATNAIKEYEKTERERTFSLKSQQFVDSPTFNTLVDKMNASNTIAFESAKSELLNNKAVLGSVSSTEGYKIARDIYASSLNSSGAKNDIDKTLRLGIETGNLNSIDDLRKIPSTKAITVKEQRDNPNQKAYRLQLVEEQISVFEALSRGTGHTAEEFERFYLNLIKNRDQLKQSNIDLQQLSNSASNTSKTLEIMSATQRNFADSFEPQKIKTLFSSGSLIRDFSGLAKPNSAQFVRDANLLPVPGAGASAQTYQKTNNALRSVLSQINPELAFEDFRDNFENGLLNTLGPSFDNIIKLLSKTLGEEDKFEEFRNKLRNGINEPLNELMNNSGLNEIPRTLQESAQAITAWRQSVLENTKTLFAKSDEIINGNIQLGQQSLSNRRMIGGITGAPTVAGLDNSNITGAITRTFGTADPSKLATIITNLDNLAAATSDPRYVEASNYVSNALSKLGDVSSRTGDIMTRLNEVEASRAAKIGLRESFITGDSSTKRTLSTNLRTASAFIESGGNASTFGRLMPQVQKAVIEGLRSFGDATVAGTGKSGNKLADTILGAGLKETGEKDRLVVALTSITGETEKVNTFLLSRLSNINASFLSSYSTINGSFLSSFADIIKSGRGDYATNAALDRNVSAHRRAQDPELDDVRRRTIPITISGDVPGFAKGGLVNGFGNRDSVLAKLTPGEFVIPRDSVQEIGVDNLQYFANGGEVRRAKREAYLANKAARRATFLASRGIYNDGLDPSEIDVNSDPVAGLRLLKNAKRGRLRTQLKDYFRGKIRERLSLEKDERLKKKSAAAAARFAEIAKIKTEYVHHSNNKEIGEYLQKRLGSLPFSTPGFAGGGLVNGVGNTDSVSARLTPGEFVLTKKAVSMIGVNKLASINKLAKRGFGATKSSLPDKPVIPAGYAEGGVVTGGSVDVSALDRFNNMFGLNIEKLSQAAQAIPHSISMNVNHKIEVIHNGAQVFEKMQSSFVELAAAMINTEINKLIKSKFPDVGLLS